MYKFFKRGADILISLLGLIILSPVLAITALCIKIDSKGPVIFKQQRLGKDGKVFEILKFRSMCVGAEHTGSGVYSGKGDARVTKVGKFIRATSIDELPQLVNILKGDMSLVGPRPQLVRDMVFMTPEQRMRHGVRPGLSGLAQVRGRNAISWEGKLATDLEYIQKVTFWGDVKIIFLTVKKS